jgi:hypothetical protein
MRPRPAYIRPERGLAILRLLVADEVIDLNGGMSGFGPKQTFREFFATSAFGGIADIIV